MKDVIVFDLECTCWDPEATNRGEHEIIEIGAVRLDPFTWKPVEQYEAFCRPTENPILTEFCTTLTGIRQEDIKSAQTLKTVLADFSVWCHKKENTCQLVSWGKFDKSQMLRECLRKDIDSYLLLDVRDHHVNFKQRFWNFYNLPHKGDHRDLLSALDKVGLKFEGSYHRAAVDATNIANLLPIFYPLLDKSYDNK